jgi:hypothetical protein
MADDVQTTTVTIDAADGSTDEVSVPRGLLGMVATPDQTQAETVGDVLLLSFASRAHNAVHHGEDPDEELEAQEAHVMDLFEDRFGVTFGEATGHQH